MNKNQYESKTNRSKVSRLINEMLNNFKNQLHKKVEYLGNVITTKGVHPNPNKVM